MTSLNDLRRTLLENPIYREGVAHQQRGKALAASGDRKGAVEAFEAAQKMFAAYDAAGVAERRAAFPGVEERVAARRAARRAERGY